MPLSIFWLVLFVLWVLSFGWSVWRPDPRVSGGSAFLLVVLVGILGWAAFGPILQGR